jgi:hypothetical protein
MKRIPVFVLALLYSFCVFGQSQPNPLLPATWNIKSEELLGFVTELASDKYEGRLTGSIGYQKSAKWMAAKMEEWGILAALPEKSWFQEFKQPYVTVLPGCSLTLHLTVGSKDTIGIPYHYFDEYMPGSTSGSGEITAEVVFVGYGISAPELGYDDYSGVNVKGKIVLMKPEAPLTPAAGVEKFSPWQPYSLHQYKMLNAIKHGALGVLYHYGPLANTNNDYHRELLVTMVGGRVVEDLFKGTGKIYGDIVTIIGKDLKPQSFSTGKTVTMKNLTEYHPDGVGMNVIGLIPGSDPVLKNEVIIIGGHLDHCGMDWDICPGANDNASGISVIMGVAKAIATSGIQFKRSIMFMGIGAEEQGLIGSKVYVANPVFPAKQTIGVLNLDCVGIGPNLHAGGGVNYPDLYKAIDQSNNNYVHRNLTSYFNSNLGRPRSDAAIFMQAGMPTLSFSSSGGSGAYHTPDDIPSTIWPETLEDLATILTLSLAELALVSGK